MIWTKDNFSVFNPTSDPSNVPLALHSRKDTTHPTAVIITVLYAQSMNEHLNFRLVQSLQDINAIEKGFAFTASYLAVQMLCQLWSTYSMHA